MLPKAIVRERVSQGTITHSQLIWIPGEHTWKAVKELPELLSEEKPVERLILHVKGTESQTQEMPKPEVKAAISQGRMTHSQLIWIPGEHTWKPVREIPDLLPGETLILHVKGTEAETQVLPKQAVQVAVSRGQITHSQLIWIPSENSWKPVRELPDLLPGERLILHVKGTEAETKELPKRAIRTALAKGEITHSQLIWSPNDHAWKQVRELPELLPSQKLAPAPMRDAVQPVPRVAESIIPESPVNPVARAVASTDDMPQVRVAKAIVPTVAGATPKPRVAAVAPPKVSVLSEAAPKVAVAVAAATVVPHVRVATPAAEVPHVRVATPAVEVPQVRVATPAAEVPHVRVATPAAEVPQVRVATPAADVPQVRAATASVPQVQAAATEAPQVRVGTAPKLVRAAAPVAAQPTEKPVSHKVHEEDHYNPIKWLCIGLGVVVVTVVLLNYLLVDQPLTGEMAKSSYSSVGVYAHLGAYIQPNVMVIHIRPSAAVTPDTLGDFMVALAHNTPDSPLTRDVYARVAITSGWLAQYSFSGYSWKQLGDMAGDPPDQIKEFIMTQMSDAAGQSMMPESTLSPELQQEKRDRLWSDFEAQFTSGK